MRGTGPSGPSTGDQEQWRWNPNLKLKKAEKREIVARVIQITVSVRLDRLSDLMIFSTNTDTDISVQI